jgi:Phosphorylase superfamily
VVLIAATALERKALRRALPQARIVQTGIGLAHLHEPLGDTVISCGVAGGLRGGIRTGTLLLPREVRRPDGRTLRCDPALVEALAEGAQKLGLEPLFDPLLTAQTIVNGTERAQWAQQGYAGVDMETGRLTAQRIAAVRVVLDTPENELSADWSTPLLAILNPANWAQAHWLAREAPRAAALAASVVAAAHLPA